MNLIISLIIMMCIGIGVFLGFNIEWKSIEYDTSEFFTATNYADYRIYSKNGFSAEDIAKVKNAENVQKATRYLFVTAEIADTDKTVSLNVSEDYNVSTFTLCSGKEYYKESDGIWLSDKFATRNGYKTGDTLTLSYNGIKISGKIEGLIKSGENMICIADSNQIMPDYTAHGFAYISPKKLKKALGDINYPQINILSDAKKSDLENSVKSALGITLQVTEKDLHTAYAGAKSEADEGKTMGYILPVLFLAIAILTMVTTMHRLVANEKVQIGTLKALGFKNRTILRHYTSYGFFVGIIGTVAGVGLGYLIAGFIMSPNGMMATYFDLPHWKLVMPTFCIPVIILTVLLLTFISYRSAKSMLNGTPTECLRPYTPKNMRKLSIENIKLFNKLSFSVKWNLRDIMRHKARSVMTLLGVFGCMLLTVGALGMNDTMHGFLKMLDTDMYNYNTKIVLSENTDNTSALKLSEKYSADWQSSTAISYNGESITMDIFNKDCEKVRFLDSDNNRFNLTDDGVYLCLRLKNTAKIGEYIQISPYGSDKTYTVKVAGYYRSLINKNIVLSDNYAKYIDIDYRINSLYTEYDKNSIATTSKISALQKKSAIMESYNSFMELLNLCIVIMIGAALLLLVVVLYNLGIMSFTERSRELATLKVLGFRNNTIAKLLINQNVWLTLLGIILGLPGGIAVVYIIIKSLATEYELSIMFGPATYLISTLLTFAVSLIVGIAVARKNKRIDMISALKFAE